MLPRAQVPGQTPTPPLRLWPGIAIVTLQWFLRFLLPLIVPTVGPLGVMGGVLGGLALVVWWAFFSRAPRVDRWGGALLMIVGLAATSRIVHESIATGAMGMLFYVYAIPVLSLAFVVWAAGSRSLSVGARRWTMVATVLVACGAWALVQTGGFDSAFDSDFSWRWAKTAEERMLDRSGDEPMAASPAAMSVAQGAAWPGFRGPNRDSIVPGVRIGTEWSVSGPVELWRRPIGPGWSSFAVHGDLLYTQEQRGDEEVVACYRSTTGEPVWRHRDAARFWESNAGAGPRGTPTLSGDRVYTFGATGILNALDAGDGTVVWSRDVTADTGAEVPMWGFASSPVVVEDLVIVAVEGALAGYDLATGDPRWVGTDGGYGYSSPHLLKLGGVEQVLLASRAGVVSVAPRDGTLLWEHLWPGGARIAQPALMADGDLLLSRGETTGIRRLAVALGSDGWTVEERWTSNRLKPYFSDFVVHEGHAYGFDGSILACIDLADGERRWKGGRYGSGQLVLLSDQDLLLVLSEQGELALVEASPEAFTELARAPAIEGKTWNHPVVVDDLLLVRNGLEMAAFRLPPAGG